MKTKTITRYMLLCLLLFPMIGEAQIFSDSRWDQNTLIMGKWSPLFYELNIGANVNPDDYSSDFIYFSIGYNKPTTSNEWNKYLSAPAQESQNQPSQSPSAPTDPFGEGKGSQPSQPSEPSAPDGSMDGLHAAQVSLGWQHYFNHAFGFHVQAGWGFVADFGGDPDEDTSSATIMTSERDEEESKKTFVYNGIPVQVGLDLSLWENLIMQVGVTYMWKERPVVTVGIGFTF